MELYSIELNLGNLIKKPNFTFEDFCYCQEIKRRELYLYGEISTESVSGIAQQIRDYNREDKNVEVDKRTPIKLRIFSVGGSVFAGDMLLDEILLSKTPVYTINEGLAGSMAGLIFSAGHKRFAKKHSTIMLHDGFISLDNTAAKTVDFMRHNEKMEEQYKKIIVSHSKIKEAEYNKRHKDDWYMTAEEAKEKGLVDVIIGVDDFDYETIL